MLSLILAGVFLSAFRNFNKRKLFFNSFGMKLAHFGIAVTILGIGVVSSHSDSKEVILDIGESVKLNNYEFTLLEEGTRKESNFFSQIAYFEVENLASGKTFNLKPEKAFYPASKSVMTESAISINLKEDVYISLSERLETGEWIAKIQTKPFIRFIWLGALLMTLGGVFAFTRRVLIR